MTDLANLAEYRPALLRHCYRMLGSFADAEDLVHDVLVNALRARDSYAGDAPLGHWLMRIATNACLNELARRNRRGWPTLDRAPADGLAALETLESSAWITPAPDAPLGTLEARESVALAFVALLQRLPPRQRAALLLKDVVGWTADEIASALELSVHSVNSALHRARETIAMPAAPVTREPTPEQLRAYIRSWEAHDVDGLLSLLREDIAFAMPPHATWFHGRTQFERFLRGPQFTARWAGGFRVEETRANGVAGFAFYHGGQRSSMQVVRFADGGIVEIAAFLGPGYFRGFDVP